ncbi:MAG: type II toxin-antitoxin system VapC family toxin [Candidatus Daviesbacteria bacterium]|nr:type II toxin-antitoxin system VapC family toxin [Candidatus Daviesbacteria bacterium]
MSTLIIVVDSSVIIKWISQDNEKHLDKADKILEDAQKNKIVLITPELARYEVGNVLLFGKNLLPEQAKIALTESYKLPVSFISESEELSKETFKLAFNLKITYYDASFLALAKLYNAILVTDNTKHQGRNSNIKVTALNDY